jgi:hypothetical protein
VLISLDGFKGDLFIVLQAVFHQKYRSHPSLAQFSYDAVSIINNLHRGFVCPLSENLETVLVLFFFIDRLVLKFTLIVYSDKGETDFMDIY